MKFFNILLDPDQESGGEPEVKKTEQEAEKVDVAALLESVSKLEKALKAEREEKANKLAEEKAKAKQLEDAAKTTEQKLEERLRELEGTNNYLQLERKRDRCVREAVAKMEESGYKVDLARVDGLLSVSALNTDNVEAVVSMIVDSVKVMKADKVETPIGQKPAEKVATKYEFGKIPDDALVGSYQTFVPDIKI